VENAANDLWMFTGEMFEMSEAEKAMVQDSVGIDLGDLKAEWMERVKSVFEEATLALPTGTWMQHGGKDGNHSEHLGYILAELQFVQRAYPGMKW
jgi:ring-1,2-phenylacetyl-CoA epoxidase subunit PaaC